MYVVIVLLGFFRFFVDVIIWSVLIRIVWFGIVGVWIILRVV